MTDLSSVPLVALSKATKEFISTLLNPVKCIPSDDGLPRDWRGLAHLSGLGGEAIPNLSSKPDPCGYILNIIQEKSQGFTILEFQNLLEKLDRWDIIDDTVTLLEKDVKNYKERSEKFLTSDNIAPDNDEEQILTYDDAYRLQQGLEKQYYDAFLLFDDADVDFADEITENLEKKSGLKLCRKDRDFVIGLPFEHSATMTLISERCHRLIVIVSPNFLKSPANKFFLNYAQALGIDKGQRKIIPCLYEKCQLPPEISYYFVLDYNRGGKLWDFWGRLRDSVKIPVKSTAATRVTEPTPILKIEKSDCDQKLSTKENEKCCEKTVNEICVAKKVYYKPCDGEKKSKCISENVKDKEKTKTGENRSKRPLWGIKVKKLSLPKQTKKKCSLTELNTCESLADLNSSLSVSMISLPETSKSKTNFVNKYVNKVKGLMKS